MSPCGLERTLFLYIIFNIEHQNCHKSFLMHYVLLNIGRYNFVLVIARQILARNGSCLIGLKVGLEIIMWPCLGLEKKILALALALAS